MITYSQIEEASQHVKDLKDDYLRRWGWTQTSHTPGSLWVWKRDFADLDEKSKKWHDEHPAASPHVPYGLITTHNTDTAVSITVSVLDEQPELDKEEDGEDDE